MAGRPAGQRHRYDQRARRQVLAGREHRPDQGLGPHHDVGPPDDQGQQEQPRVQLAGVMAQLSELALVQRPPGGVGEHGLAGELTANLLRAPPQLPEGPVLGLAQRRDRAGQPDQGRLAQVGELEYGPPFGH